MGPLWGPHGSCQPQLGPILAPWTLLLRAITWPTEFPCTWWYEIPCLGRRIFQFVVSHPWPCSLINSLAPGGFENIFQNVFFKLISWIDTLSNSCETALRSMPQNPSDDKSTLVQVMAWCRQAASHYLSQCCPRSLSPYGVTRPQWVNSLRPSNAYMRRQPRPSFVQVTACRLFGAKPLSEPMLY